MLPQDVFNIIADYNEVGIFVIKNDCETYWFNGKRFEYWCKQISRRSRRIMTYENDLYFGCMESQFCYKNKQFITLPIPKRWNHPLNLLQNFRLYDSQILLQNNVYRLTENVFKMFDGNCWIKLPMVKCSFGEYKIIADDNHIYLFTAVYNKKFDIVNKKWIRIANSPPYDHERRMFYIFNGLIYSFNATGDKYWIYHPQLDIWEFIY